MREKQGKKRRGGAGKKLQKMEKLGFRGKSELREGENWQGKRMY